MKKNAIVFIMIVLLVWGGLGMLGQSNPRPNGRSNQNSETYDDMMARMHPGQVVSSGGDTQANVDIIQIRFSQAVGKRAPDFTLTRQDGKEFTLSDYANKTVILFFNEGAMCYPACWNQIEALASDSRFNTESVITASIVIDPKYKWDKIIGSQPKYGKGILLFDTNKAVSNAYDILNVRSSMHKGSFPGHTYVIIKNGIIDYVMDDPNMALNNNLLASKI